MPNIFIIKRLVKQDSFKNNEKYKCIQKFTMKMNILHLFHQVKSRKRQQKKNMKTYKLFPSFLF